MPCSPARSPCSPTPATCSPMSRRCCWRSGRRTSRRARPTSVVRSATTGRRSWPHSSTRSCCSGVCGYLAYAGHPAPGRPAGRRGRPDAGLRRGRPARQRVSLVVLSARRDASLNMRGAFLEVLERHRRVAGRDRRRGGGAGHRVAARGPVASLLIAVADRAAGRGPAAGHRRPCCSSPRRPGSTWRRMREHLWRCEGVTDVHDLHAWTITSGMPALSAHVTVTEPALRNAASAGPRRAGECAGQPLRHRATRRSRSSRSRTATTKISARTTTRERPARLRTMTYALGQGTGPLRGGPGRRDRRDRPRAARVHDPGRPRRRRDPGRAARAGGAPGGGPHDLLTRGRPSVALDLKRPEAVETVLELVEDADVLVEGMRPGRHRAARARPGRVPGPQPAAGLRPDDRLGPDRPAGPGGRATT